MRELQEKDILFGAAYYPEYMPYERLQEDIAMMQSPFSRGNTAFLKNAEDFLKFFQKIF